MKKTNYAMKIVKLKRNKLTNKQINQLKKIKFN